MARATPRDSIYRGRRFSVDMIELCVRWYLTYRLSYRDLAAMMAERGIDVTHTTIMRWVLRYVPEYEKRSARFARPVGLPGAWMRPPCPFAAGRTISIAPWTGRENRSIHYSARHARWRPRKPFAKGGRESGSRMAQKRSISMGIRPVTAPSACLARKTIVGDLLAFAAAAT